MLPASSSTSASLGPSNNWDFLSLFFRMLPPWREYTKPSLNRPTVRWWMSFRSLSGLKKYPRPLISTATHYHFAKCVDCFIKWLRPHFWLKFTAPKSGWQVWALRYPLLKARQKLECLGGGVRKILSRAKKRSAGK